MPCWPGLFHHTRSRIGVALPAGTAGQKAQSEMKRKKRERLACRGQIEVDTIVNPIMFT